MSNTRALAGAKQSSRRVRITRQMIDAGVRELVWFDSNGDSTEEFVKKILRAALSPKTASTYGV